LTSSVRISELPVADTLNDRDFIVINTQNIVTRGIAVEDFLSGVSDRNLIINGERIFNENVTLKDLVVFDGATTFNAPVEFTDEVSFKGVTDLPTTSLTDISTDVPSEGDFLQWRTNQYVPTQPKYKVPYQIEAPTGDDLEVGQIYINNIDNKLYVYNGTAWVATT